MSYVLHDYRIKIRFFRRFRDSKITTIEWAIYDTTTGGIVLLDDTGAQVFRDPDFWSVLESQMHAVQLAALFEHPWPEAFGNVNEWPWGREAS